MAGGDARGATGRVVQGGETIDIGADDLLIRPSEGRLRVEADREGTVVADGVWAHLAGARHLSGEVEALLDRVAHVEERA